jgi:peroxiredoxin
MRTWFVTVLLLALELGRGSGAAAADDIGQTRAEQAGSALIGTAAPVLKLTTIDGQSIDLSSLYGKKAVYLKFLATWCVPCLQQMPHFEHAFETEGSDLEVIAINTNFNETPESVAAYRQRHGLKMPIVMDDGRLAAALNLRVTPQHVLIARDGRIAYVGHLADEKLDLAVAGVRQPQSHAPNMRQARVVSAARPTSVITTSAGEKFTLRDPKGQRDTVLVFMSPWCEGYLKDSRPTMSAQCREVREQTEKLAPESAARWIGIASGLWADAADLRDYQQKNALRIPLALDASGNLFRSYAVTRVPTVIVLSPDGHELHRASGGATEMAPLLSGEARKL